jgi:NitT/TauT family transport system ATP-binding protein
LFDLGERVPNSNGSSRVAIAARGLARTFATRHGVLAALAETSFDIYDGEFVCVVGPSGCGKSTLLRIASGLLRPSSGELILRPRRTGRVSLAMVFQEYGIYPWKTVLANVSFGLQLAGVARKERRERAITWLRRLHLEGFAASYPATLSGGMKQRVAIARALAIDPEFILMDEPFAALDAQMRLVLQRELLSLWESDRRTVIFVTHSLDEAILLGDRVMVMSARPGRILADITIPFPRPRAPNIRADPRFAEIHEQIWNLLRPEVEGMESAPDEPGDNH